VLTPAAFAKSRIDCSHTLIFKLWIMAIFQGERIKNADVFALFPPAIPFFPDVAEIVSLNRVPLAQAALCSDGLYYSGTKVGKMQERMQAVCAILNSLVSPDIEKLVP
jgi:hypothetical protein